MPCSSLSPNASSLLLRTRPVLVRAAAFAVIIAWVVEPEIEPLTEPDIKPDSRYTNRPLPLVTQSQSATSN
jgi:hypothetical protein